MDLTDHKLPMQSGLHSKIIRANWIQLQYNKVLKLCHLHTKGGKNLSLIIINSAFT